MFGIGFGELVIILVVLLIAVGPDKMPTFMKAVGKGLREFRRATRELRSSVGIDELLRDEDLRDLRRPIDLNAPARRPAKPARPAYELTDDDLEKEFPSEGTDLAHMKAHPPEPVVEAEPEAEAEEPASAAEAALEPEELDPDELEEEPEPVPVAREADVDGEGDLPGGSRP